MHLAGILERITERVSAVGATDAAVSRDATGSPDTIRNWRRSVEQGNPVSPRLDSLQNIAKALGTTDRWLIYGDGDAPSPAYQMQDPAELFVFTEKPVPRGSEQMTLRAIYGDRARQAATFRVTESMMGLGLLSGDIVVTDLSRRGSAQAGELAVVRLDDGTRCVRRVLPPFLLSGDPSKDAEPILMTNQSVTIVAPVIGSIRGMD